MECKKEENAQTKKDSLCVAEMVQCARREIPRKIKKGWMEKVHVNKLRNCQKGPIEVAKKSAKHDQKRRTNHVAMGSKEDEGEQKQHGEL